VENVIECINLTHKYGNKLVYENMNFTVQKGRIFGLLGKNGMGKTTSINILMGFLRPTSGRCMILGDESHKLTPRVRARIGLLHEGHVTYDFMNVTQIEKFYSRFFPNWKKEFYYDLVDRMHVPHQQVISHMSCGQRSQVALGLILAQNPELMILDDYSMGLDAGYRMLFMDFLTDYVRAYNKTVFMTSHIIQDMEKVIDDAIIMGYQKLLLQAPLKEFMRTFHRYIFETPYPEKITFQEEGVKNTEVIRNHMTVYTFCERAELENILSAKGVEYKDLAEESMTLEEAFIGLTGKY